MQLQISSKCLPSVLKLPYLEDLILEGCFGIDNDSLAALEYGCKSLKVLAVNVPCSKDLQFLLL